MNPSETRQDSHAKVNPSFQYKIASEPMLAHADPTEHSLNVVLEEHVRVLTQLADEIHDLKWKNAILEAQQTPVPALEEARTIPKIVRQFWGPAQAAVAQLSDTCTADELRSITVADALRRIKDARYGKHLSVGGLPMFPKGWVPSYYEVAKMVEHLCEHGPVP